MCVCVLFLSVNYCSARCETFRLFFLSFLLHINVGNIYIDMKLSADHSHARGHDLQLPFATLVGAGNYGEKQ